MILRKRRKQAKPSPLAPMIIMINNINRLLEELNLPHDVITPKGITEEELAIREFDLLHFGHSKDIQIQKMFLEDERDFNLTHTCFID
jgi:hypothetical protein